MPTKDENNIRTYNEICRIQNIYHKHRNGKYDDRYNEYMQKGFDMRRRCLKDLPDTHEIKRGNLEKENDWKNKLHTHTPNYSPHNTPNKKSKSKSVSRKSQSSVKTPPTSPTRRVYTTPPPKNINTTTPPQDMKKSRSDSKTSGFLQEEFDSESIPVFTLYNSLKTGTACEQVQNNLNRAVSPIYYGPELDNAYSLSRIFNNDSTVTRSIDRIAGIMSYSNSIVDTLGVMNVTQFLNTEIIPQLETYKIPDLVKHAAVWVAIPRIQLTAVDSSFTGRLARSVTTILQENTNLKIADLPSYMVEPKSGGVSATNQVLSAHFRNLIGGNLPLFFNNNADIFEGLVWFMIFGSKCIQRKFVQRYMMRIFIIAFFKLAYAAARNNGELLTDPANMNVLIRTIGIPMILITLNVLLPNYEGIERLARTYINVFFQQRTNLATALVSIAISSGFVTAAASSYSPETDNLRQQIMLLENRQEILKAKSKEQRDEALQYKNSGKLKSALNAMKRKKLYDKQIDTNTKILVRMIHQLKQLKESSSSSPKYYNIRSRASHSFAPKRARSEETTVARKTPKTTVRKIKPGSECSEMTELLLRYLTNIDSDLYLKYRVIEVERASYIIFQHVNTILERNPQIDEVKDGLDHTYYDTKYFPSINTAIIDNLLKMNLIEPKTEGGLNEQVRKVQKNLMAFCNPQPRDGKKKKKKITPNCKYSTDPTCTLQSSGVAAMDID